MRILIFATRSGMAGERPRIIDVTPVSGSLIRASWHLFRITLLVALALVMLAALGVAAGVAMVALLGACIIALATLLLRLWWERTFSAKGGRGPWKD